MPNYSSNSITRLDPEGVCGLGTGAHSCEALWHSLRSSQLPSHVRIFGKHFRFPCNVLVGITGTLFEHSLAVEIAMFRIVGVRNRVVGECQVVDSHCKMISQLLECWFACVVFSYGSISLSQQQRRHRNRSAQLIRYAQLYQQQQ